MNYKIYTRTGLLRLVENNILRCHQTKEDVGLSDCMKCTFYNGFRKRTHPRFSDHVFCKYQTESEKTYDEAIKNHKCPDCGTELTDYLIKDGAHKGHGRIVCLKCNKAIIMI
jgi:hypothetical protein